MKKLILTAIVLSTVVVSCKKDTKTITKTDPETGKTVTVEVPAEEAKKVIAITDSAGIYKQTFLLEKGQTYPFTTYQKNVAKITAPDGKFQTITSESTDEVSFKVDHFENNIYDITIHFLNKRTSQSGNGQSAVVDTKTAEPKEEMLRNKWVIDKALTGNTLKMKMDKNGKIISITGFEPIYTKISTALSKLTKDSKVKAALLAQTKEGFNEKILKEQFSKNLMVIPEKGAKIGDTWKETEDASEDGKIKLTTNYALKSVENGIVTISVSGGIPNQSDKQSQNGVTHTISSSLNQNGTMTFDQNTGWIKNQNIIVKTSQKESMTDGKQTETMTSNSTSTVIVNPSK